MIDHIVPSPGVGATDGQPAQRPRLDGPPAAAELIERIGWLIKLRWIAIVGVFLTLELVHRVIKVPIALRQLQLVMIALALYNLLLAVIVPRLHWGREEGELGHWRTLVSLPVILALAPVYLLKIVLTVPELLRHGVARALHRDPPRKGVWRNRTLAEYLVPEALWGMPREWEAYQASVFAVAQITIDLLALAGLVHYSGGVENPFMFFFIFHVIISSILLARRAMFLMTTLAIALAMVIGIGEYLGWLPHYPLNLLTHQGEHLNPAFVFAQLFVLAVTLILAAYMASSIVVHMRSYEREVVFLSDELKAKAEKLESANARMTRVEQTKSQYMRKVAHELKGPLGTIQVVLKVVLDGLVGEISEQARDMIKRAERRAGELAQAVQDLLVLTRAKDGTLVAEMVPVDIAEITADLIVDLREAALQAEVTVNYEPNGSLGRIEAEPTAIRQLVSNLIGNAIRYSRPGGSVQVRLAETDDGLVELEVQDTGIGIPPEDCQRIFEEFFRSGNAKKHAATGTGLGLAIVKAVTDQHGGTVAVESQVGVGTRFTVRLPRQRSAKSAS